MTTTNEPETITIAGVTLTLEPDGYWRAGNDSAWIYNRPEDAERHRAGQWGCSLYFGPASIGGVAPTLEALDRLVRERVEQARQAFERMPSAERDARERALVVEALEMGACEGSPDVLPPPEHIVANVFDNIRERTGARGLIGGDLGSPHDRDACDEDEGSW